MKQTLQKPQDIPSDWKQIRAKKNTFVTIRDVKPEGEEFSVSWADSKLTADPLVDLVVIQPSGKEYPCKIDIFFDTYKLVEIRDNLGYVFAKVVLTKNIKRKK